MPFKSQAQRGWMYANKPAMARRWEKETPVGNRLPKRLTRAPRRKSPELDVARSEKTALAAAGGRMRFKGVVKGPDERGFLALLEGRKARILEKMADVGRRK